MVAVVVASMATVPAVVVVTGVAAVLFVVRMNAVTTMGLMAHGVPVVVLCVLGTHSGHLLRRYTDHTPGGY